LPLLIIMFHVEHYFKLVIRPINYIKLTGFVALCVFFVAFVGK